MVSKFIVLQTYSQPFRRLRKVKRQITTWFYVISRHLVPEYLVPVKQIRELSNTVKIFLMSSCEIGDSVVRNAMIAGVNEIIKKPISAENLNIILQDYIDGIKNPLDSALKL